MAQRSLVSRLAAASALALVLAACEDRNARVDVPEPAPLAELEAIDDLPAAPPAPIGDYAPARGYPLAERAYGLQRAVYDTPPDYGFAYDDEESYVWETADDWAMYAEPWDDGYRYYYYEPGAAYPYFVRDRDYGYGYDAGGILVAVFDSGGRYLPRDYADRMAPNAGRYYVRGHQLWQARRDAPRIAVTERVWAAQAPRVTRTAEPWLRAAREQPDWRTWRERDGTRELRRFEGEQRQRQVNAEPWRERRAVERADERADVRGDRAQARAEHEARGQARRQADEQRQDLQRAREAQVQPEQQQASRRAERQAHAQRQAEAQAQRADAERRHQAHQQAKEGQRQQAAAQARAEQAQQQRQRQEAAQAERAQAHAAQQAARAAEQAQARAAHEQARAAEQSARAAAGREGPRPDRGGGPDKADKPDKPHGNGHGRKD